MLPVRHSAGWVSGVTSLRASSLQQSAMKLQPAALISVFLLALLSAECWCRNEEERLINFLITEQGYNKELRPVKRQQDVVDVYLALTLSNLISLKEVDETLLTNVWIDHTWVDFRLAWNMTEFDGIKELRLPSKCCGCRRSNDAQFEVAYYSNVVVYSDGLCYWLPPAIFRSSCSINVNYFPFDWQNCTLKFVSLTYNAKEIKMLLKEEPDDDEVLWLVEWIIIDPASFTENGEWEINHAQPRKNTYEHIPMESNKHQDITFYLIIKRKPLFYIVNIIIPCVLISFLASLVYYLPADICLPAADLSETARDFYVCSTYCQILDVHHGVSDGGGVELCGRPQPALQDPSTHVMSDWTKKMFLDRLPRILRMSHQTAAEPYWDGALPRRTSSVGYIASAEEYYSVKSRSELMFEKQSPQADDGVTDQLYAEIKPAVDGANYIIKQMRNKNDFNEEKDNWSGVARTVDRLCLFLVTPVMTIGTVIIFLMGVYNIPPPALPGRPPRLQRSKRSPGVT
ncbi:hypothetical protein F7725_028982, partial [Dissostichus mawsoni]